MFSQQIWCSPSTKTNIWKQTKFSLIVPVPFRLTPQWTFLDQGFIKKINFPICNEEEMISFAHWFFCTGTSNYTLQESFSDVKVIIFVIQKDFSFFGFYETFEMIDRKTISNVLGRKYFLWLFQLSAINNFKQIY